MLFMLSIISDDEIFSLLIGIINNFITVIIDLITK